MSAIHNGWYMNCVQRDLAAVEARCDVTADDKVTSSATAETDVPGKVIQLDNIPREEASVLFSEGACANENQMETRKTRSYGACPCVKNGNVME